MSIRKGQEAGEIRRLGESGGGTHVPGIRGSVSRECLSNQDDGKRSSREFFAGDSQERRDVYALTDGVSDEQFEAALTEASDTGEAVLSTDLSTGCGNVCHGRHFHRRNTNW